MIEQEQYGKKVVIVTGAGSGIGKAVTLQLLNEGYCISAVSRTGEHLTTLKHTVAQDQDIADRLLVIDYDLANLSNLKTIVEQTIQRFGIITGLVNNAGISYGGNVLSFTLDEWTTSLNINLSAPALLSQYVAEILIKQQSGGSIVNVSSLVARKGASKPQYAASKAGVLGLTRAFAAELGKYHIRVNAILPGAVKTGMTADWNDEKIAVVSKGIPLGRLADAAEIANLISFLLSDKSSYITGEAVNINGGSYLG